MVQLRTVIQNPAVGFGLEALGLLYKTIETSSRFHLEGEPILTAYIRLSSSPKAQSLQSNCGF